MTDPKSIHSTYLESLPKFAPGILVHLVIQLISPTVIQAFLLHTVCSGLVISAAVRGSAQNEFLESEYSSRQMAYMLMMVRLLMIIGAIVLIGFGISSSLQERLPNGSAAEDLATTYKGLAVTALVAIGALTRFWIYCILPFIYPDTPAHLGGRQWYFGFDRRRKMLAQPGVFRSASLPATAALIVAVFFYAALIWLDRGTVRSLSVLFFFIFVWPFLSIIVARAGLSAALPYNVTKRD